MSRSIQALEFALGEKLFVRSRAGVSLTAQGNIVLDFCDKLFTEIANVEKKLKTPSDPEAGVVEVGTFESLTSYLWPNFLKRFSKTHPALQVRLSSGNENEHRRRLLAGALQMVVEAEPTVHETLKSVVLYYDSFRLYAQAETPRERFDSAPIIYVPQATDRDGRSIRDHLLSAGISPQRLVFALDTFSSALEFVKSGLGIGVLPTRLVESADETIKIKSIRVNQRIPDTFGRHRICATFRESSQSDSRIKAVLSELKLFVKDT